ncbi:hypothetical protein E1297_00945, partial [Roseibium sp. RKSG952]|nr:hypothetical protein [Roseibium sp. RKSG952]
MLSLRRLVREGIAEAVERGLDGAEIAAAVAAVERCPDKITTRFKAIDLVAVGMDLDAAFTHLKGLLEPCENEGISDQSAKNFRLDNTRNTTENSFGEGNQKRPSPDGDEHETSPDSGFTAETALENEPCGTGRIKQRPPEHTGIHHVRIEQVRAIASDVMIQLLQETVGHTAPTWADLVSTA